MEAGETVIGTKAYDCVDATTLFQKLTAFGLLTGSSPTWTQTLEQPIPSHSNRISVQIKNLVAFKTYIKK